MIKLTDVQARRMRRTEMCRPFCVGGGEHALSTDRGARCTRFKPREIVRESE